MRSQAYETEYNQATKQISNYRQNRAILQETIDEKEQKIQNLQVEVAAKTDLIEKLNTTISVQAKQISKYPTPSPHRQRGQEGTMALNIYQHPPPAFPYHGSLPGNQKSKVSQTGVDEQTEDYDASSRITYIFKLTSEWASKFANTPDGHRDRFISADLHSALAKSTFSHQVQEQLASEQDRYLLIASFVNRLIVENIYRPQAFCGYNHEDDKIIQETCKHIGVTSLSHIQHSYQGVLAERFYKLRSDPCFPIWIQERCHEFAEWTGHFLAILITPNLHKDATMGLRHVLLEAYYLSVDLHAVNRRYKYDFIRAHRETYYNQHTMLNRDVTVVRDPISIRREEYRVRLCISPTVVIVDFVGETLVPKTVHLAEVLLWKPQ